MKIRLGHSPDPDDAFMFWALAAGEVDARGFEFEHVLRDIQTLNEWALEGRLEVTAISLHSYPFVQDRYVLLPHGASMGAGYGPIVVAARAVDRGRPAPRRDRRARPHDDRVPRACGSRLGDFAWREVPFDQIMDEVASGKAEAGLLIHEGQLTVRRRRAAQGARPGRVVACRHGPPAAARRERRPARPRARRPARALGGARRFDPRRARQPRAALEYACSGDAASTTSSPTASSACT